MKGSTSWHPVRWVFLIVGIILAVFAYSMNDVAIGMLALFVGYQAIMNVGCVKTCYTWVRSKGVEDNIDDLSEEITYEEIL